MNECNSMVMMVFEEGVRKRREGFSIKCGLQNRELYGILCWITSADTKMVSALVNRRKRVQESAMDAKKRRNRDEYAVIPVTQSIEKGMSEYPYDDHLALAGLVADRFAQMDAFAEARLSW